MDKVSFINKIEKDFENRSGVIGICGLPGSGKTTLARELERYFLERALVIGIDDFCEVPTLRRKSYLKDALDTKNKEKLKYLTNPEKISENPYANPLSWYDWNAIEETLSQLRLGKTVMRKNCWDQQTGACDQDKIYQPKNHPHSIIIIEGIYLFENNLPHQIDVTAMLQLPEDLAEQQERTRDQHRNDALYLYYKALINKLYCVPYLEKYKENMDYIIT
jgi:uridine kinase